MEYSFIIMKAEESWSGFVVKLAKLTIKKNFQDSRKYPARTNHQYNNLNC